MKRIIAAVLLVALSSVEAQDTSGKQLALLEESLSLAKNVCAAQSSADVWVFRHGWVQLNCSQLGAVFALDAANPFDSLLDVRASVLDMQK